MNTQNKVKGNYLLFKKKACLNVLWKHQSEFWVGRYVNSCFTELSSFEACLLTYRHLEDKSRELKGHSHLTFTDIPQLLPQYKFISDIDIFLFHEIVLGFK